ncbi:MAG: ATP phosphoribosyltransferase regulatory subunit [Clostridiales bacterium]|nr:ATP phosphoribosyltransferase regulatory subunit [Clostridiales bacterium]
MNNQLLHTPDGVRDIYGGECAKKRRIEEAIQEVFHLYGYQDIETPTFEFFDIFKAERGSVGTREMYKFFDRDNNTLVLRPDMTPPIARCAAKYYMNEDMPIRLCYKGSTYNNGASYRGQLKETTQTGVELIGNDSSDADAEMIAIVIDALKATGLREFQVELGQVEFYRGLVEEAGIPAEIQERLRELIESKNYFGVEELLNQQILKPELKRLFLKLPELFGDIEQIRLAKSMMENSRARKAIERLERVQEILDGYGLGEYVSYDLGMLSKYSYYTGIIFKAYTYGTGEYIVTGGRYDRLLEQFGKKSPAIGLAIMVDPLMMALSSQKIPVAVSTIAALVLYEKSARLSGIRLATRLRRKGKCVQLTLRRAELGYEDYMAYARRSGICHILYLDGDGLRITAHNLDTGESKIVPCTDDII